MKECDCLFGVPDSEAIEIQSKRINVFFKID